MIKIKRGLDLPISGAPEQTILDGPSVRSVALVGYDYIGLKPSMLVQEGEQVKPGQPLFIDKKNPRVTFTAPAGGRITGINRGPKRVLASVVIDIDNALDAEQATDFRSFATNELTHVTTDQVIDSLLNSGLWAAFRTRPFSKIPDPDSKPNSIFVTAMDTNPLAANPDIVIDEFIEDFSAGLTILTHLTEGKVFVCKAPSSNISVPDTSAIQVEAFSGPHPAGLAGTHIHFLDPVSVKKTVWTINYQDVIAVGKLFLTGKLWLDRFIALGGPNVENPCLLRTRLGASTDELTAGKLTAGESRIISGSVLSGRISYGDIAYLGRYHQQVSVLEEGRKRELLHYLSPGFNRFSVLNTYISKLSKNKKFAFTTTTNGSERAMVPVGAYEKMMPLDILPTQLLRALIVSDTDTAQKLGCLELDEEDLGLCTYACPGKYEYAPILRDNLTLIEKEG